MMYPEKSNKSSNCPTHLSLSLDNSMSSSSSERSMESMIIGRPSNSLIELDTFKNMAIFVSSSSVFVSFNGFKISTIPFQLACICFILTMVSKDFVFLASSIIYLNLREKVDKWLRNKSSSWFISKVRSSFKDLTWVPIFYTFFRISNASDIRSTQDLISQ